MNMNRMFEVTFNKDKQTQLQQQLHLAKSSAMLDSKIENARKDLERIRGQRQADQAHHKQHCATLFGQIGRIQHQISQVRRQNNIRMYCKVVEGFAYAPSLQRKQGMLLKIIHSNEVNGKYIELSETQNQRLAQYMLCEVSVLEDERAMLEVELLNRKNSILEEMRQMQNEFSRYAELQRKVTNKLHSMITLGLDERGQFYANTAPRSSPYTNPQLDGSLDKRAVFDFESRSALDLQKGPDWSSGELKKGFTVLSDSLKKMLDRAKPSSNDIGVGEPLHVKAGSTAA